MKDFTLVVDTNTAWAAPIKRFADQLREARAADPLPPLLRKMDEMRQRATHEALQPPSSQHDPEPVQRLTSTDVVTGDGVEDVKPVKSAKRTRKRKPTLAAVARQAAKAGVEVAVTRSALTAPSRSSPASLSVPSTSTTASPDPKWN